MRLLILVFVLSLTASCSSPKKPDESSERVKKEMARIEAIEAKYDNSFAGESRLYCQKDSDCKEISFNCAGGIVNRWSYDQYYKKWRKEDGEVDCDVDKSVPSKKVKLKCLKERCQYVEVKGSEKRKVHRK